MNLNKAQVIGRVTKKPEAKALPSGASVTSFSIATNRKFKKDEEWVEQTEFHNVVAFGGLADTITRYVVQGQELFIEGRLQTRTWEDKESGKKMYRTEIVAEKMEFGQKPKGASNESASDSSGSEEQEDVSPEDIPF